MERKPLSCVCLTKNGKKSKWAMISSSQTQSMARRCVQLLRNCIVLTVLKNCIKPCRFCNAGILRKMLVQHTPQIWSSIILRKNRSNTVLSALNFSHLNGLEMRRSCVSQRGDTMKKIISSRSALVSCSFAIILFFGLSLIPLGLVVFGESQDIGAGLLLFSAFFGLSSFLLWFLNRAACIIRVEDGMIKRKGLIHGFYKECSVRAIQTVKIKYVHREVGFGTFIYLIDDRTRPYKKFFRIRKDSYICFRKNKKNLAFLRTFWSGVIEK